MAQAEYNSTLHHLAWATAIATFPLIFMGGLVTSKGVGLSVPDWPNSYGYNMFLLPWSIWSTYGVFYEHTHRLLGTVVGFCSILLVMHAWGPAATETARRRLGIALVAMAVASGLLCGMLVAGHRLAIEQLGLSSPLAHVFVVAAAVALILLAAWTGRRREPRRWVRWLAVAVLAAVVVQGVLGGLRVVLMGLNLAIVHAVFAQTFFCLAALMCVVTSRWWCAPSQSRDRQGAVSEGVAGHPSLTTLRALNIAACAVVVLIFAQLIAGALMRHHEAGLAIPDLPLAYGQVLPPIDAEDMHAANQQRVWQMQLPMVSLAQVWMHFAHRVGAVLVTAAVIALMVIVWRNHRRQPELLRPTLVLVALLLVQIVLGVLTVLYRKPADIATAHVAIGALVLVLSFVIMVRAVRLYGIGQRRRGHAQVESVSASPAYAVS